MSNLATSTEVTVERKFIDSETARQWLRKNIENNRPMNQDRINNYARDMKTARWKENGDTIKFSDTGELIDGQHRLTACVQAGVGFWSQVAYGVQREAFMTIDRNQVRSTGQLLHLAHGVCDYNVYAGVITWLWRFRDGIMLAQRQPTQLEAEIIMEKHPLIRQSISVAKRTISRFKAGPASAVAACHYLFSRQDAMLAELFFDSLATGANLREKDAVYRLRERIVSAHVGGRKMDAYEIVALYFKAWQAEREKRTINAALRWSKTELFPNIGPVPGFDITGMPVAATRPRKPKAAPAIKAPKEEQGKGKLLMRNTPQ